MSLATAASRPTPEVGAECVSSARSDLSGGRGVTRAPTGKATQPPLPDVVLHDRLATREAMLRLEPLEDPPRRMPLLARPPLILLQDPVDDAGEPVELGPRRRLAAPVPRRHGKPQHLGHRLGVDAEDPSRLPLAHPLRMAGTPNPRVEIHDFHPHGLPSAVVTKGEAALLFHAAAAGLPSRSLRDFLSDALTPERASSSWVWRRWPCSWRFCTWRSVSWRRRGDVTEAEARAAL